jgi:hypothetical protein
MLALQRHRERQFRIGGIDNGLDCLATEGEDTLQFVNLKKQGDIYALEGQK